MKCCREITIEGTDLRVYPSGSIWRFHLKKQTWTFVKGTCDTCGYLQVGINKKFYLIHRLVARAYFGFDLSSPLSVDHRDRNPINNGVWNLRVVTNRENQWNKNSKGVYKHSRSGWCGTIYIKDKQHAKWFKTEEEALLWRKEMKKIHHVIPEPDYKKIMSVCLGDINGGSLENCV